METSVPIWLQKQSRSIKIPKIFWRLLGKTCGAFRPGVSIHWTGLLDWTTAWTGLLEWNTGLDYWTDLFAIKKINFMLCNWTYFPAGPKIGG